MSVNTDLFVPQGDNKGWKYVSSNSVNGVQKSKANHSERALLNNYNGTSSVIFLLQNAFPCDECHDFLKTKSIGSKSIIVKVVDNKGEYSRDHGLGSNPLLPCILYYYNGSSRIVNMSSRGDAANPPQNFPGHPDVEAYDKM